MSPGSETGKATWVSTSWKGFERIPPPEKAQLFEVRIICICKGVSIDVRPLAMELARQGMQVSSSVPWAAGGDRIGVVASVLCAIHCAATPIVLIVLPAFGKVWTHPASHWVMAALVIPLAAFMVAMGFRKHRRKWVIASGTLGIVFVLLGAAAPSFGKANGSGSSGADGVLAAGENSESAGGEREEPMCASPGEEATCESDSQGAGAGQLDSASSDASEGCVDACCPSIQEAADGGWRIHIPLASILTTIGGFFLILTHIGNLWRCDCDCCEPEEALT